jgi:tetratricopeptide (TPR) repeat protein
MVLEAAPQYALCLNMIVKDESHIIKNTLTKLLQKIKFDYWVISDTGSTDETMEIITDFFKEVGIPGELYEDEWVDFSHNRNKALEYAFGKSKYLLIFDADDEMCGDFVLPELVKDYYHFQFGSHTRYTRTQIVNNCKRWKYVGVLHECIVSNDDDRIDGASMEIIKGPYYTVSGRSGNRNLDSNKYLKDAIILEKAYYNAVDAKDEIYNRYGFYCANSYYDCEKYEDAISWYKKTLENFGWSQEKYVSCLKLYKCYEKMNNIEAGFFYLVKSAEYDRERAECYYELIKYYSALGLRDVAYGYYGVLRDFYRDTYLKDGLNNKLFLDESVSEFYLPYYVIIVSEKMRDYDTGVHMYTIIFTKKCKIFDEWFIGNMLYNLQFFTEHVKEEDKMAFYSLFQEYVDFLVISNNYPIYKHDEIMKNYQNYGVVPRVEIPIKKKYAVCMWGQLRSVKEIIENLYKNLLEPLEADFFIMAQKTGTDNDKNIDLFKTENKIMYQSPDVTKIFINYNKLLKKNNYLNISHLNIYYNFYKIGKTFGDIFETNYEYIILTRSDFLHLFPFPDVSSFFDKEDLHYWCYDGHEWGGINATLICVPSTYIKSYLFSFYTYLQYPNNVVRFNKISRELNSEYFIKVIFDDNNWKIGKIEPNAFITASSLNEITTWGKIYYSDRYNLFYKYEEQMIRAFNCLNQYKNNEKWHLCCLNGMYKIILMT